MSELQHSEQSYSALAWELARRAPVVPADGPGVVARCVVFTNEPISGAGPTSTAAAQELAREFDSWSERMTAAAKVAAAIRSRRS